MNIERINQLIDAYNLRANTAAIAESTASIDGRTGDLVHQSGAMVQHLESLLDEQTLTNELLDCNLRVAVSQNKELRSISSELSGMATDLREVTTHLRERANRDSREEALKELLYASEEYQKLATDDDSCAKAYGARLLKRLIANNDFRTKDLSTVADKRYFDKRIAENDEIQWDTPPEIFEQLDRFETAYALYHELRATDVTANLPAKRELRSLTQWQIKNHIWETYGPRDRKHLGKGRQTNYYVLEEEDIEKAEKLLRDFPDFIGEQAQVASKPHPSLFGFLGFKTNVPEPPKSPFPRDNIERGWSLADAVAYPGFLYCHPPYDDQKYFGILGCGQSEWRAALSRIVRDHKAFAKKAPDLIDAYTQEIPLHNAEAEAFNRQIEEQESALRLKHDVLKKGLTEYINGFLHAHPAIKRYLRSV